MRCPHCCDHGTITVNSTRRGGETATFFQEATLDGAPHHPTTATTPATAATTATTATTAATAAATTAATTTTAAAAAAAAATTTTSEHCHIIPANQSRISYSISSAES